MDLSRTIIPKSDQINFEDVQSTPITATIKSVREGSKDQPVFIDLVGYDGRPYKPSKSMRRVLIGGWGNDGHAWAGRSLTLIGDPTVKFGGVAVGGIKIHAMSHIESDLSFMLSVSRGKRAEHRVKKLMTNFDLLSDFTGKSGEMTPEQLDRSYHWLKNKFTGDVDSLEKLEVVYQSAKSDMEKGNG
ncbi:hypothetical protein JK188_01850 [Providencia sp. JGM181]|uniref:hypothetical protein n=1 Tax=unclassified Providencia TaxID=2633465 RepID=UPI001BAA56DB|nr:MULTISPECIES: hypothetical protein [unclassified Providencia]MBS0923220.1 hypothetical protein [Providencia sp. JGM181]MBS0931993.1 hypothetical protein [Providencia sp. JGM172]MBS0996186.1 hypothetical protein [Providencia sp. JGM178]